MCHNYQHYQFALQNAAFPWFVGSTSYFSFSTYLFETGYLKPLRFSFLPTYEKLGNGVLIYVTKHIVYHAETV